MIELSELAGARRNAWATGANARAQLDDSCSSREPSLPSGETIRDCTVTGSTGT